LRAVVFDFYGTLTPGRTAADQKSARTAQAVALGVDPAAFDHELTATIDARFRGVGGDVPGSLAWVAGRLGHLPSATQLAEAADVRLSCERAMGQPRDEAVAVLSALREQGLRIGVVSDCSAELPLYFPDLAIAPYVDLPVFSSVTGHRKPEPANYLACATGLGVQPGDCLYVGDGGSNELGGAQAVGMHPVHLNVAVEQGSVVYERHADWDGPVIRSLSEVLALV